MPWHTAMHDSCPADKPWAVIKDGDNKVVACHMTKADANKQMAALYAKMPKSEQTMMRDSSGGRPIDAPIIQREASISSVDFAERIVRMVVVPYEEQTVIVESGGTFIEEFDPDAFKGIETRKSRIPIYRGHDPNHPVGLVQAFDTTERSGLVAEAKISKTTLGDETLQLAADGVLGASVGAAVRPSDSQRRRVTVNGRTLPLIRRMRAFVDHIGLLPNPAYLGAQVLAVRQGQAPPAGESLLETPNLDSVLALLGDDYWKSLTRS